MTENEYRTIWEQTEKAVKYLHKKGCMTLCDPVSSGFGEALLLVYNVSDADEKAKAHGFTISALPKNFLKNLKIVLDKRKTI